MQIALRRKPPPYDIKVFRRKTTHTGVLLFCKAFIILQYRAELAIQQHIILGVADGVGPVAVLKVGNPADAAAHIIDERSNLPVLAFSVTAVQEGDLCVVCPNMPPVQVRWQLSSSAKVKGGLENWQQW